jgi:hypothetical protein
MTHSNERLFTELWQTVARNQLPITQFRISENDDGWVSVEHRGKRRYYPLAHEISSVLLSGDLRRGAFD